MSSAIVVSPASRPAVERVIKVVLECVLERFNPGQTQAAIERTILKMTTEDATEVMIWMDLTLWCMPRYFFLEPGRTLHHFDRTKNDLAILGLSLLRPVAPDQNVLLRDSLNPDFVKFLVEDYSTEFSFDKGFVLAGKDLWPEWKLAALQDKDIWAKEDVVNFKKST